MTISTYQVDNVIKAYHKQIRLNQRACQVQSREGYYIDEVSLSSMDRKDIDLKISYSLRDILLKNRV